MGQESGSAADSPDDSREPLLFDVGAVALAHSNAPMRDTALEYVRDAIQGNVDVVVPYQAVFGAHHILNRDYGFARDEATYVLTNFLDSRKIDWYVGPDELDTREGLGFAGENNIEGWDGYYAQVALATGATTIITLDNDFERVDGLSVKIPLTEDERERFHEYHDPENESS